MMIFDLFQMIIDAARWIVSSWDIMLVLLFGCLLVLIVAALGGKNEYGRP